MKFRGIGLQRIIFKPIKHFLNIAFQNTFNSLNIFVSIRYTIVIGIVVHSNIIVDEEYIIYRYVKQKGAKYWRTVPSGVSLAREIMAEIA